MKKTLRYYIRYMFSVILCYLPYSLPVEASVVYMVIAPQEIRDKQSLLNGRIWRDQYAKVSGDQFFLSGTYLKGSLTFNGRRFNNLDLLYDIADDELILKGESNPTIILNKEMVDSFSLFFQNRKYYVINAGNDSASLLKGYINVLYDGPSALYVKFYKKIQPLAEDGKVDLFYQGHHIYIRRQGEIVQLNGKKRLLYLLSDSKKEIRDYIRKNRLRPRTGDPESFVPVLKFYDSLKN